MENLVGLFIGIGYGYFLGCYWVKERLRRKNRLEDIEVIDAEVVEIEEIQEAFFICDFENVEFPEVTTSFYFKTVSHDTN